MKKYRPFPKVPIVDREWPNRTMTSSPVWCAVDLRDGNQALQAPMSVAQKIEMFKLLVDVGFKEIEVGFPAASTEEFDFIRYLIENDLIPDDVTIQVLTQARKSIIERTFEAIAGVDKCIVHMYNSTSELQRRVVFNKSREEIIELAVDNARIIQECANEFEGEIRYEYSPESFTGTELDFALEICQAVMNVWQSTKEKPVIINLPATVEMAMPNIYADQIEWFCKNLNNREGAIVSVHAHNDRGTAVAATELAFLAGADRVEGTLFGNGERTGNVDLMTLALNMFVQGIDTGLDFSNIDNAVYIYEKSTGMQVHPRHPYAGELVYTAYSGSHQDAIAKGMKALKSEGLWEVPYLPIDPKDVGRTYEKLICINSQSGKGGVAHIMRDLFGFNLPEEMRPGFAKVVQLATEQSGRVLKPQEIKDLFDVEYLLQKGRLELQRFNVVERSAVDESESFVKINTILLIDGEKIEIEASGNGPIDAFCNSLQDIGFNVTTKLYFEHSLGSDSEAKAISYIKVINKDSERQGCWWGAGIHADTVLAAVKAIISAVNRIS